MDQPEALNQEIQTKGSHTRAAALKNLREAVRAYDPESLAAALAGLGLLPHNASFQLRLESMIDVVASRGTGNATPTSHRIANLCNGTLARDLVSPLEDPAEYPVTEPLAFENHVYTVFTGQGEEVVFACELLFDAFAEMAEDNKVGELTEAVGLIRASLSLEEAIAARAGLGPGIAPRGGAQVEVPRASAAQLAEPVLWSAPEIEAICLAAHSTTDAFAVLATKLGEIPARAFSDSARITFVPLLRCDDGAFVVRPGQVLPALGAHLQKVATSAGLATELAKRYAAKIHRTVFESALRLGAEPLRVSLGSSGIECLFEGLYRTDDDSAMIFLTVGDASEAEIVPAASLESALNKRARELIAIARSAGPYTNILVCVVPAVLPGHGYKLHEVAVEEASESIALTAPSLEVIAFHEHDSLALDRYARSVRKLRQNTHVMSFSPLDLFALYRDHDHSFYLNDDRQYSGVSVEPGYGLALRLEMLGKQRRQSATGPQGEGEIEVVSGSREGLPIFRPRNLFDQPLRLVRLPGRDFWVVCPPWPNLPKGLARFNDQLADAVAYWVWRTASEIFVTDPPAQPQMATFFVDLDDPEEWRQGEIPPSRKNEDIRYQVDATSNSVGIFLEPSWQGALAQPENFAERYLVWLIAEGLIELLDPGQMSDERVREILNRAAPTGQRRMLLAMESDTTSLLGSDGALPAWRAVSDWERGWVRDDLAAAYRAKGFAPAPAGDETAQNRLIHFAVSFFLAALVEQVAHLSPDGLLEDLLRREESLIAAVGREELTIPTRLACFGDVMDVTAAVGVETRDVTQASIAHRFLVEYVSARPPQGTLPLSNARYDHLLALAASIAEYGFNSDVTHYKLDDLQARILPSGRLGIAKGRYEAATERWTRGISRRQIEWSKERFANNWAQPSEPKAGPPSGWEGAFEAEFGYSMTQLREVLDELLDLAGGSADSVACWPREALITELANRTHRPAEALDRVLSSLTLSPRANFELPEGFGKEEVYPWRFNRRLSLLRRPMTARGHELLWGRRGIVISVRHLLMSIETGRLAAHSPKMLALLSEISTRQGDEFENEIAGQVMGLGLEVRQRVKKLGKRRLIEDGRDLGDIDVLAIDVEAKRLWVIECKSLSFARTPWELASEVDDFADPGDGIPARHRRRMAWLHQHLSELAAFIGQPDLRGWQIEPVIVVETDLLTLHLHEVGMPVTDPSGLGAILQSPKTVTHPSPLTR